MQKIKNIIFDLGGVILNIDLKRTELAFAALGIGNFKEYYTLQHASPLFHNLELGLITPGMFFEQFRQLARLPLTDEQIKIAWNALLLDFPPERIQWVNEISKRYNIYLLSNTNEIHYDAFTKIFKLQIGNGRLDDRFIKAYYSHKIGLRKPSKESYNLVLKQENLIAGETLFIDDSLQNIEGAKQTGLQTIYLPSPHTVLELDL
jgi:putative hydrolase of the HAD superfamily